MDAEVAKIIKGEAAERVWLLEHPPIYTAGTSARGRRFGRSKPGSPYTRPAAAVSTPIMARDSGLPT